ncbi:MAG: NADH-quinone oxidoreductase subunit N [Bacteroidetes bacterium]|nr:NADH-quinone oxidoreductase subunit N [Bacteroidota bacterium]
MPIDLNLLLRDTLSVAPVLIVLLSGIVLMMMSASKVQSKLLPWVAGSGYLISFLTLTFVTVPSASAFSGMVNTGSFAVVGGSMILALAFLHTMVSANLLKKDGIYLGEFYALQAFAITGMLMMVSANDLIMVFIGIETMSIPFYAMAGLKRKDVRSNESAMKYFLIGAFAAGFLLYGIALIYGATGTTNLTRIADYLASQTPGAFFWVGIGLMLTGFFFKVSAVPFHFWAPDVYQGAPTVSSAFLATGGKMATFMTLALVSMKLFPVPSAKWAAVVAVVAALSMIIGNVTALAQTNVKRILGYSSVAHAGYLLLALLSQTTDGYQALAYYVFVYGITTFAAFAVVGYLEKDGNPVTLESLKGLGFSHRTEGVILTIAVISLMGIPPMGGFVGKYLVFLNAYESGHLGLVILGVVTSMVSIGYYLRIILSLYTRPESTEVIANPAGAFALTGLILAAVIILVSGLYPPVFTGWITSLW